MLDPCDNTGFEMTGVYVCPEDFSCGPYIDPVTGVTDTRFGRCVNNGRHFGEICDPADEAAGVGCATGTFCQSRGNCEMPRLGVFLEWDDSGAGNCYLPQREGQACDGNWGEGEPGEVCAPCEPGTICDPDMICRRPCTVDGDCPCNTETAEFACGAIEGVEGGRCNFCYPNSVECDEKLGACCDNPEFAACQEVEGFEGLGTICCRAVGNECTGAAPGECCPGSACNTSVSECQACIPRDGVYDDSNPLGCCGDNVPRYPLGGGVQRCLPPCSPPNTMCRTCANAGSPVVYTFTCTDDGDECPVDSTSFPGLDTTCDDMDDDCDGVLAPNAWVANLCGTTSPTPTTSTTPACPGETFQNGREQCLPDTSGALGERCIARQNQDYCAIDAAGNLISNAPAGCISGNPCDPMVGSGPYGNAACSAGSYCKPNEYPCSHDPDGMCDYCRPIPGCGPSCWEPGMISDGACP